MFIASMKSALTKAPARRSNLLRALKDHDCAEVLPPVPVLTRWTTWVIAANYYWENFNAVVDFIKKTVDDSAAVKKLKQMTENQDLALQLERLSRVSQGLQSSIRNLENDKVPACSVWLNLKATEQLLEICGLRSEKLEMYFKHKHTALEFWHDVQTLDPRAGLNLIHDHAIPKSLLNFHDAAIPLHEIIKYEEIMKSGNFDHKKSIFDFWNQYECELPNLFKLAMTALSVPASSASVERSFSKLKWIFSRLRTSLTDTNLEAHMKVAFNGSGVNTEIDSDDEEGLDLF